VSERRARSKTSRAVETADGASAPDEPSSTAAEGEGDEPVAFREGSLFLVVRQGDDTRVVELTGDGEVVVGRAGDAAITVDEPKVSRRHARIVRRGSALFLVDLGSRNGTWCNGKVVRAAERPLAGGDLLRIGSVEILVAAASGEPLPLSEQEKADPGGEPACEGVVIADPKTAHVFAMARKVARTPATVLLLGETGVGKEVMAKQIHAWSPRASAPFVRVNCAALPETLLESELFGFEKGAFSGADRRKIGYVEAAHRGTLLIDEVGELSAQAQVKLLSMLENRAVVRLGGTTEIPVDVRVICATHRDLAKEVEADTFRADLFYRIKAFTISLPPLRERVAEIALLVGIFARAFAATMGENAPAFAPEAIAVLQRHRWPGNVRELRNAVEHALVLAEGETVSVEHLPDDVRAPGMPAAATVRDEVAEFERQRIERALAETGGNQARAAKLLGISRRTLVYRLARYRAATRASG
jgi:DNA-binding NtrC family response regulator